MSYDLYSQLESFDTRITMNTMSFLMKNGEVVKVPTGRIVSREGEPSDEVFIIVEGEAGIEKCDGLGGITRVAVVESGGLIGEMGVFLQMKRTATVVAYSDLTLVKFTNEKFINALPKTPDINVRLLKSMAQKINDANRNMSSLSARNSALKVGLRLLDHPVDVERVQIDMKELCRDTGLTTGKVVSALKLLLKKKLIGQWDLTKGKILTFDVNIKNLRDQLMLI